MTRYILYFLISLGATTIGSFTGMGGGVIIKPLLDALGDLSVLDISIISSVTVFSMALVSVVKQISTKTEVDTKIAFSLAVGSVLGGVVGERLLANVIKLFRVNGAVVAFQNTCLATLVIAVFVYMRMGESRPVLDKSGVFAALIIGTVLGMVSTFLGIGGGPINVALIIFVFSYNIKDATVYSIIIILSAQVSKLLIALITGNLYGDDISIVPVMVVGAIFGGWIGSRLNKKITVKVLEKAFNAVQVLVFIICLFNIFRNLSI